MTMRVLLTGLVLVGAAGCHHVSAPRDVRPPAPPQGLVSVTGDTEVRLSWLPNGERDLAGYRVYMSDCASGPGCPYLPVGRTSGTSFVVRGLANGVTRFFAVAAYDHAGNESALSYEDVFDTPRPEGFGLRLANVEVDPDFSGYDFSRYRVVPFDGENTDIFYAYDGTDYLMVAAYTDTDIQNMGFVSSLDAIDWAPSSGWSPTGTVRLAPGNAYVVWTHDDHYAKFRVVSLSPSRVIIDWAYQVDPGNRELRARKAVDEDGRRIPRAHGFTRG